MNGELRPVSDEVKEAFEQWHLLIKLLRKSQAIISMSMSRIDRGDRLRAASPSIAIGGEAYLLAETARHEAEAHTYLSIVPGYYGFFKEEIIKVRDQIEGGLNHE